jgi:hypothetical protein
MKYIRLYSDEDGESHFEDVEPEFQSVDFAPPAPPLDISTFGEVENCSILRVAPSWVGDWHPAPFRQLHCYLSGQVEAKVSDGETRLIRAGELTLVEDTTGKGHRSCVVGDGGVIIAVVKLA